VSRRTTSVPVRTPRALAAVGRPRGRANLRLRSHARDSPGRGVVSDVAPGRPDAPGRAHGDVKWETWMAVRYRCRARTPLRDGTTRRLPRPRLLPMRKARCGTRCCPGWTTCPAPRTPPARHRTAHGTDRLLSPGNPGPRGPGVCRVRPAGRDRRMSSGPATG
jgi:hypothetical protein